MRGLTKGLSPLKNQELGISRFSHVVLVGYIDLLEFDDPSLAGKLGWSSIWSVLG